ncbi:MAG: hypothetical protein EZS28_041925, partial [Streblomastix strix]
MLLLKADKTELTDAYNKTEVDTFLDDKLNVSDQIDAFTKQEDDTLLLLKADKIELADYVNLGIAQTIIGTKQFYIISRKDGTDLKVLETEQYDMANVITTLGTATGGDQKIFNTTINSVGIQVQNYDNSNVVCAVGGVKAIQDINASVDLSNYYNKSQTYSQTETDQKLNLKLNISDQIDAYTKTQDDALLLSKADKTQLIDAYSKTEADALLDDKLNVSDQIDAYTKILDDALLLLKADKTQLIDSYTKGETNNLLNNKANSGVSYTKGEDDALLLLKAHQSTTYTKTETDY